MFAHPAGLRERAVGNAHARGVTGLLDWMRARVVAAQGHVRVNVAVRCEERVQETDGLVLGGWWRASRLGDDPSTRSYYIHI